LTDKPTNEGSIDLSGVSESYIEPHTLSVFAFMNCGFICVVITSAVDNNWRSLAAGSQPHCKRMWSSLFTCNL